jgi:amino acid transporter
MGITMIWIAVGINLCPLTVSKWVPNFGTITRLVVVIGMIASAVIYFLKNGRFANEINLANIMPDLNAAIVFIPIIIYNLEGCELISAASGEMKNPARDIPKAVILSAIAIAVLYLIATFAVWVVIPVAEINVASGILHVFTIAFSGHWMQQAITLGLGFLISSTLFAEIVTWNLGENRSVAEAANNGELPKILGKMNKSMAPVGASIVSGIISTVVIIIYGFIAKNAGELFWHVVSFSLVVGLFSYLMLFPSFIILRIKDKNIQRPYQVPGPNWVAILMAVVAEIFILSALCILLIQPGHDFLRVALPIIIGVVIAVVSGEILINRSKKVNSLKSEI